MLRPAGVLTPGEAGRYGLIAGFSQLEAQVMRPGMVAEATCISKPLTIIPMVVTEVQDLIAAGQVQATDRLIDPQQVVRPGTITVYMEPLYAGGFDGVPPGSSCIVNAYTNNHDRLADPDLGTGTWLYLHVVDTVGVVHAMQAPKERHLVRKHVPQVERVVKKRRGRGELLRRHEVLPFAWTGRP
jgi:multidrug resistance efflux pump